MDENAAGTEADIGPDHIVLYTGSQLCPHERGTAAPLFSAHVYCGRGRPSQLLLSSCLTLWLGLYIVAMIIYRVSL